MALPEKEGTNTQSKLGQTPPVSTPKQEKAPPTGAQSLKTSPNSHSRGKDD